VSTTEYRRSHMRTVWAIPLLTSRPTWARTSPSTSISSPPRALDIISRTTTILASPPAASSLSGKPTALMGLPTLSVPPCPLRYSNRPVLQCRQNQNDTQRNADKAISLTRTSPYSRADGVDAQFKFGYQLNRMSNDISQHWNEPATLYSSETETPRARATIPAPTIARPVPTVMLRAFS